MIYRSFPCINKTILHPTQDLSNFPPITVAMVCQAFLLSFMRYIAPIPVKQLFLILCPFHLENILHFRAKGLYFTFDVRTQKHTEVSHKKNVAGRDNNMYFNGNPPIF